MSDNLTPLKIKDLLSNNSKYSIPIYQRNYAWGEKEITQLIQDIVDYSVEKPNIPYYLGSLVVYEKKNENNVTYETIDGQQRLTTLTILLSALKNNKNKLGFVNDISWFTLNLSFDSRIKSTETLKDVFTHDIIYKNHFNTEIKQAYDDCLKIVQRILKENKQNIDDFCNYLFEKVMILRVPVPPDTDLNHYFEIMNSRGEQLEKHEVLKAQCLEYLTDSDEDTYTFNLIWEACSNMEKYVQYGFKVPERNVVFGNNEWNTLLVNNFNDLSIVLSNGNSNTAIENDNYTVIELINEKKPTTIQSALDNENPDRFNSVINFSNFLLHVLRIQESKDEIALILSTYDELIENNKQRIKLLEEMAEEIYKEWFVRLRFPGYENTKVVDGLPKGWEKKSINSIVDIISGYAFKTEAFDSEGIYKLVTIKNVQDGFFVTQTTDYIYELPKNLKEDCKLKDKDIILSLTGNIGRICMVYGENYLLNQRVAKLKPKKEKYFEFVYLMFRSSFLRATLENLSNGAAQQNLSPIEMGKLEFPIPSDNLIDMLSKTTKSFFDEIITLNKKNKLLQETRDLLLPRLISGKLNVEHLIEESEDLLMVAEPITEYKKN